MCGLWSVGDTPPPDVTPGAATTSGVGDVRQTIRRATLTIASLVVLGIPVVLATPQAASAATACTRVGNIQVTDTDDNAVIGYVSKIWNNDGQFVVTTTPSDYLSAQVTDGAQTNIAGIDDDQLIDGEVLGATSAVDQLSDLATGSGLYSSLGGTIPTAPGATPHYSGNSLTNAFDIETPDESAIWTDAPGTPGAPGAPGAPGTPGGSTTTTTTTGSSTGSTGSTGSTQTSSAQTVSSSSSLPTTGADLAAMVGGGLAAIGLGVVSLLTIRRRRTARI